MNKELETEVAKFKSLQSKDVVAGLLVQAVEVDGSGVKILTAQSKDQSIENLREMADLLRDKLSSAAIVLATENEGKVNILAAVTKDLTKKLHAGNIIKEVAKVTGGGGGGRPDLAQAGGKDPTKIKEALELAEKLIREQLSK